jgi:hypothetical protein
MRLSSRTARRFDAFDKRFDKAIAPILTRSGFAETQPYVYTRQDPLGQDVVYFDVEPKSFIVHASFRPEYMDEIDGLYEFLPNEPVLGAASYLAPNCMTHRPKEFPCRLAAKRDHSFSLVAQGLTTHALSWLTSLRVPVSYADAVPPTMMMYLGRANEVAHRLDRAKEAYEEQMRRELLVWSMSTFNEFVASEGARVYVYLCLKLEREQERCRSVMDALKFYPDVQSLRNGN